MIEATGKQIIVRLDMVTGKELLHTLETLADNGYWIDSVQCTSELLYGSADYLIVYHPVNTIGRLVTEAIAAAKEQP